MKARIPFWGISVVLFVFAGLLIGGRLFRTGAPVVKAAPATLDWLHYGNDLANTRFQDVDQINPSNVANLKVAWEFRTGVMDPKAELETSPIVVNGTMYITDGHDDVFALDAATGNMKWSYKPIEMPGEMPSLDQISICCGQNNRGVVFVPGAEVSGKDRVIYGRLDNAVVALDAGTGTVLWKTVVADFRTRVAINLAPQYAKGLVIVALSGGEYQVQGQVIALHADTGTIAWRFFTTAPGTWGGDSWKTGGAMAWQNPSIDPDLGLLYFGTGNAAPDINGVSRIGDNLYSSSAVALDLATGKVRWYFQETHHDLWDYDSTMTTVLFPVKKGGQTIPALGHCSKNGNYYILDRRNGNPVFPVTEVKVPTSPAWQHASPTQPMSSVEPLTPLSFVPGTIDMSLLPAHVRLAPQYTLPQQQTYLIVPGDDGGCEGIAQGYSPRTKYVYYGTRYEPTTFFTFPSNKGPNAGGLFLGSTFDELTPQEGVTNYGLYGATDTVTGKVVWSIKIDQPAKSGVLIAGDLVFFGEGNGKFHAVDAATGNMLFTFDGTSVPGGGGAQAAPVAYVVNGKEYIVNGFGGNVPDRHNFPPNPVGDAVVAFTLP
ncbi:MAG TPA: PQQ-binding-like beta-propeller repeat protein [Terriglobales bacterium]|nr:PQQ-binding-like beta-propeller repeat protein [Terriglobales bacterium]